MGSHFVGKSETINKLLPILRSKGHTVENIPELARHCPLPINENTTYEAQLWILIEQIRREMESNINGTIVVTDRTVLDNFAYMYRRWKQGAISDEQISFARGLVDYWIKSYDHIFLLAPFATKEIQDDSFRSTNKEFRQEIHDIILGLINEKGINVTHLNGDVDANARSVLEHTGL